MSVLPPRGWNVGTGTPSLKPAVVVLLLARMGCRTQLLQDGWILTLSDSVVHAKRFAKETIRLFDLAVRLRNSAERQLEAVRIHNLGGVVQRSLSLWAIRQWQEIKRDTIADLKKYLIVNPTGHERVATRLMRNDHELHDSLSLSHMADQEIRDSSSNVGNTFPLIFTAVWL